MTPGQFGAWTPIAAEQTAGGYDVAWKMIGIDLFTVWSTDASGNYITNIIGTVSGASFDLQSIETTFKQDLNGDGFIGLPYIEALGSTRLDQFGGNYYLDPVSGGTGPLLRYQGAAVVAGQFGSWTPIGAERTASGYEVAWKVTGANQYSIWNTDSNGNRVSSADTLTGTSLVLKAAEVRFHQDLNGDGVIGVPTAHAAVSMPAASALAGNSFVFSPDLGTNSALASANFNALDAQSPSSGPLPAFSFSGPAAALEMLFHQVNNSYDPFVSQDQPSPLLHLTDLHGGAVFIL